MVTCIIQNGGDPHSIPNGLWKPPPPMRILRTVSTVTMQTRTAILLAGVNFSCSIKSERIVTKSGLSIRILCFSASLVHLSCSFSCSSLDGEWLIPSPQVNVLEGTPLGGSLWADFKWRMYRFYEVVKSGVGRSLGFAFSITLTHLPQLDTFAWLCSVSCAL